MGWFSKSMTIDECDKIAQKLNDISDLPAECQKYDKIVDALKARMGVANQGLVGRRATSNQRFVRRMTRSNQK